MIPYFPRNILNMLYYYIYVLEDIHEIKSNVFYVLDVSVDEQFAGNSLFNQK